MHKPIFHIESNKETSMSPFVVGLFAGTLAGCLILTVILPLWLKNESQTSPTIQMATLRWNTTGITVCGITSKSGENSTQLNSPLDLFLDSTNNIYVSDEKNHRIQKFFPGNIFGQTVAGNGTSGSTDYQLKSPSRAIVDSNGNLYISDVNNYRIQLWRNGDNFGRTVAGVTGKINLND